MLGRAAYQSPALLGAVDSSLFGAGAVITPEDAIAAYLPYVESQLAAGVRLHAMTRHMLGLFNGQSGARAWRRILSQGGPKPGAGLDVIHEALSTVQAGVSEPI